MSKKRTREQKIIAQLRRQIPVTQSPSEGTDKIVYRPSQNYVATRSLPAESIRADLVKTIFITLVGVGLQFVIKAYLDRGGWTAIMRFAGV